LAGVWLILPTYNEAENVEAIVRASLEALAETGMPRTVLIVDDNSPDGTGRIADRIAASESQVAVLHRLEKQGIGPAYIAGFREALTAGAEIVVQMDADFSHDPADLPRLLEAARGADLVIGSRYVAGGGVADWRALRRAISRGGTLYARGVLGVPVHDLTSGFKVFRRGVLEAIGIDSISSLGYAFQVETTYRASREGFRIVEVPIRFFDRRVGESKMNGRIVLEAALRVPAMRLRRPR
jgi:dolichol-phosphate mannosyltransferase